MDAVVDVGANVGQYAQRLRVAGWRGPILSIEPIPEVHALLRAQAAADPAWEVAPPFAAGATAGAIVLEVSAESDMSSTLPQSALLRDISPTSAVQRRVTVPQRRLDEPGLLGDRPWRRLFVKIDVQGAEPAVLAGLAGVWERVQGLQLELALLPLYEGERPWLDLVGRPRRPGLRTLSDVPGLLLAGAWAARYSSTWCSIASEGAGWTGWHRQEP